MNITCHDETTSGEPRMAERRALLISTHGTWTG